MSDDSRCPTVSDLAALSRGQLSKAETARLIRHLEDCESCRSAAETLNVPLPGPTGRTKGERRSPPSEKVTPNKAESSGSSAAPYRGGIRSSAAGAWSGVLAPPQGADEIGRLGIYRVLRLLGTGGMGAVFAAEDTNLRRKVALKVMKLDLVDDEQARKRFLREARAMAAVQHDRIIAVYGVGMIGNLPYLAMPLLSGESLEKRLKAKRQVPLAEALRIAREAAEGLAAAHKAGLVHRDVKPANLWLEGEARRVKILDFGLARAVEGSRVTRSGAVVGTPAFMSPEQARGETVDHRSDLFSLGTVLYRLATGKLPFGGSTAFDMMAAVTDDEPVPPRQVNGQVPEALERLILRLLDKDAAKRPASAAGTARELAVIERQLATGPPSRWGRAVFLLLLLGVLGVGGVFLWPLASRWWEANHDSVGNLLSATGRRPAEAATHRTAPGTPKPIASVPAAVDLIKKGDALVEEKEFTKAIDDYSEAIRLDPRSAEAWYRRGFARYYLRDYDDAIKDYTEAIHLDPTDGRAYFERARAWHNGKNQYEKSVEDCTEAIRLKYELALSFSNRGLARQQMKEYDKALKDFDEAIRLDPKRAFAFNRKAWLLAVCPDARVRDGRRAVEAATTACKLKEWKSGDELDTLAAAYAEDGDFASAVKWEEKALDDADFAGDYGHAARKRLQLYKDHKPYREL
jgi:serine/threonine protein kinase/Tfp pilus assembly protein PilF